MAYEREKKEPENIQLAAMNIVLIIWHVYAVCAFNENCKQKRHACDFNQSSFYLHTQYKLCCDNVCVSIPRCVCFECIQARAQVQTAQSHKIIKTNTDKTKRPILMLIRLN